MALACLLLDLSEHGDCRLVSIAHLNHRLRDTADRDEAHCRAFAERVALPFVCERIAVREYAAAQSLSIEAAARRVRYDFLERAAARTGAGAIAVGHTLDDQAETLLLKLMRGAGLTGLGAIYPRRGHVVRPLIDLTRAELRAYLASRGVGWLEDETNLDLANPRNRIRHVVMPELGLVAAGAVAPALARAADLMRSDGEWLDQVGEERFTALVTEGADCLTVKAVRLAAEPEPIARRVLLNGLRWVAGGREVGLEHVQSAAEVLAGACGGADVPGGRVELRREILVLSRQGPARNDTLNES